MQTPDRPIVLLTGATGFVGSALVERLATDYTLIALDRAGPPDPPAPATAINFDLATDEGVNRAIDEVRQRYGAKIASVVHLAGYYDFSGDSNPLYQTINVDGTRRLIDALKTLEVEQFVYASTMLVHEPTATPGTSIDEDTPLRGEWAYPESKIAAEQVLRAHHGDIPVVLLRIAGVYDDTGHAPIIAEQVARIYERRLTSHLYPGMLCAAQSFVHVDDLADAVARTIDARQTLKDVTPILIGEPDPPGYAEIQDIIGKALHGEGWTTLRVPEPLAEAGAWVERYVIGNKDFIKPWMVEQASDHYVVDATRARTLLGWQPRHSLSAALPGMVEALQRDPPAWYRANKLNPALVAWHAPAGGSAPAGGVSTPRPAKDVPEMKCGAAHGMPGMTPASGAREGAPEVRPAKDVPEMKCGAANGMPGMAPASGGDAMAMMDHDAQRTRWAHWANIGLGLWLAASPWAMGGSDPSTITDAVRNVTLDRGLPPVEWRSAVLAASDVVSGLLIALFGALSLSKKTAWWAQWAVTGVAIWLLFAPLLFWSPTAAQYQNDLLVGTLAIAFSVLVPMMPGMSMAGMMDPKNIPPGWTYCPSTAAQRIPIAALALIGLLVSRMLTAYQLGHVDHAWEPFFAGSLADPRNGTEEIITSSVSKAWPIPDAGLGALSYTLEVLMAVMGTRDRWRTMPWMVTFFGILVIPLGVVSIYFIIIQPIIIGTWSTPALVAALAMLVMIPIAIDEVIAMGQYLVWAKRRGKGLLRTFFKGDAVDGGEIDSTDALSGLRSGWREGMRGVTLPWTLAASVLLGLWLMLTRLTLGSSGAMANSDHVTGALVITIAIIATAEVARPLRFLNVLAGLWLLAAPWMLDGHGTAASIASVMAGVLLIGLSLPRGRRSDEHYAGWDKYVV